MHPLRPSRLLRDIEAFDPEQHPRQPKGSPDGGQFAPGSGGTADAGAAPAGGTTIPPSVRPRDAADEKYLDRPIGSTAAVTNTPAFQQWFGDSKVVDEEGNPLVVYHGTGADISKFDTSGNAAATGNVTAVWGSFFTPSTAEASRYVSDFHQPGSNALSDKAGNILPAYLSIQNPYEMSRSEWDQHAMTVFRGQRTQEQAISDERAFRVKLQAEGHDGIIVRARGFNAEYIAFEPTQIKSVFNRGTFDPKNPHIGESLREADDARDREQARDTSGDSFDTVGEVVDAIDALPDTPGGVGGETGVNPDLLALHIDQHLDATVWNGTQAPDREMNTIRIVGQAFADEVYRSLGAQESYDEFEARMFQRMGIGEMESDTGTAAMRALDLELETETRLAWNAGLIAANADEDTELVWRAQMDDRTTEGCWQNHGFTSDQLGDPALPRHYRCRCDWWTIPNPDSEDPDTADEGQSILDEMAAERESGQGVMESGRGLRLSKLFREAGEFDPAQHPRQPKGDAHGGEFAPSGNSEKPPSGEGVGAAQEWARSVGLNADYGSARNARIGDIINGALEKALNAGVTLPDNMTLNIQPGGTRWGAKIVAFGGPQGLAINASAKFWKDPAGISAEQHRIGFWSSGSPDHVLWHELGHALHAQSASDAFDRQKSAFAAPSWQAIANRVSQYAGRTQNEFVAEVFAGAIAGNHYSEDVQRLYGQLHGPTVHFAGNRVESYRGHATVAAV